MKPKQWGGAYVLVPAKSWVGRDMQCQRVSSQCWRPATRFEIRWTDSVPINCDDMYVDLIGFLTQQFPPKTRALDGNTFSNCQILCCYCHHRLAT